MELRLALRLLLIYITIGQISCAPSNPTTTESPRALTTVQYYVKPTQRPSYQHPDYYDDETTKKPYIPPSEFLMTIVKTALDIVKSINANRAQKANNSTIAHNATRTNDTSRMDHDHPHELLYSELPHDHHPEPPPPPPPTTEPPKAEMKPRYSDPWTGYYDFIITEGSFKFWSGFQLFTALLLLYSALSAIYFAKFNPIQPDYDTTYDDYFFGRSLEGDVPEPNPSSASADPGWISNIVGMGSQAYQRIMDSLHSNKFT